MYKVFPILLFALLISQDDIDTYLKHHPSTVNKQHIYRESYYQFMCLGDSVNVDNEDFDVVILLPDFISLNFNSILNPNNYFIKIDSVSVLGDYLFDIEHKENKYFSRFEICEDKRLLEDYYFWRSVGFINYVEAEIYIDNSIDLNLIESAVNGIMAELFPFFDCLNCIKYNSVDMETFLNNNKSNTKPKSYLLNRDDIYDDSWAVIIGIDKYKYSKQLNYAVKDAEAVKEILISKFNYPEGNIRYLVDEKATHSEIKLKLGEVATSAGANDRILVFY